MNTELRVTEINLNKTIIFTIILNDYVSNFFKT